VDSGKRVSEVAVLHLQKQFKKILQATDLEEKEGKSRGYVEHRKCDFIIKEIFLI
jgi:hypothetical protein